MKLNELINNKESWTFEDFDGKVHDFKMFVPISIVKLREELVEAGDFETMVKTVECLLVAQYDFMDSDWVIEKMSLTDVNLIYYKIVEKSHEAIKIMNDITEGQVEGKDDKKKRWFSQNS